MDKVKLKTKKVEQFKGKDKKNTTTIYLVNEQYDIPLMTITKHWHKGIIYENDVNGELFRSITKAKDYCKENLAKLRGQEI